MASSAGSTPSANGVCFYHPGLHEGDHAIDDLADVQTREVDASRLRCQRQTATFSRLQINQPELRYQFGHGRPHAFDMRRRSVSVGSRRCGRPIGPGRSDR